MIEMTEFNKFFNYLLYMIVFIVILMMIITILQGGWYCEHCLVASDRSPSSVEFHQCPKSKNGKHHLIWYWKKPEGGYNYHDYYNRNLE